MRAWESLVVLVSDPRKMRLYRTMNMRASLSSIFLLSIFIYKMRFK